MARSQRRFKMLMNVFVGMTSSEPLQNHKTLLQNWVWLCGIISQSVMQKNWFTVFNVKVTARAYIIKMTIISSKLLFLLYLLNF